MLEPTNHDSIRNIVYPDSLHNIVYPDSILNIVYPDSILNIVINLGCRSWDSTRNDLWCCGGPPLSNWSRDLSYILIELGM
jgi:hypothetical protein